MSGAPFSRTPGAAPAESTGTAPLLYWLSVISGLVGVNVLRSDEPDHLIPLWFGSVVGVALGQIFALVRVRAWVLIAGALGLAWFVGPLLYIAVTLLFGSGHAAETAVLTLLPAIVCGYASLSERGGLLAFWYPAMLWMLVILDGPTPGSLTAATSLPFMLGLGSLFIAFLHARQSRRVALWLTYGRARLASPFAPTVLSESPMRALSQHAWTGLVGVGALMLAGWIAPELWHKESAKHEQMHAPPPPTPIDLASGLPCCHAETQRERVSEYISLFRGHDTRDQSDAACVSCAARASDLSADWAYDGTPGAGLAGEVDDRWTTPPTPVTSPQAPPPYPGPSSYSDYDPAPVHPPAPVPEPATTPSPETTNEPERSATVSTPAITTAGAPPSTHPIREVQAAPPPRADLPWRWLLSIGPIGLALHLLVRAARRKLTLRHLERPFWDEPVDQRISNHWQRMLVGLRDSGIRMSLTEQPQAFARRVGIEGMHACATILDRVRHGVRVDAADLAMMDTAATSVYRTSRAHAGFTGRLAGSVRWPLV